jgi:heat shock protein HtpX
MTVKKKNEKIIPDSALKSDEKVDKRSASSAEKKISKKQNKRTLGDLMMNVNKYLFLVCVCGLKMKVPPEFDQREIVCPRCGRKNHVPVDELTAASSIPIGK